MNVFVQIRRNFLTVMSGQGASAALGFATLALNARALSIEGLGVLMVIRAGAELISGVAAFQTWQAVIRFGAEDLERKDYQLLRKRFWFAVAIDFCASALATIGAVGLMLFAGRWIGLTDENSGLGAIFALSCLFTGHSASTGLLRLVDRFGVVTIINVGSALAQLVNAALLAAIGAELPIYIYSIAVLSIGPPILLLLFAWRELSGLAEQAPSLHNSANWRKSFLRFATATSASSTLNTLRQRGEMLLVSALLGPTQAGAFSVAYRSAALLARAAEAAKQSVYPEIASSVAKGDLALARHIVAKTTRVAIYFGAPALAGVAVFGGSALALAFGPEFRAATLSLFWLSVSSAAYASMFALSTYTQVVFGAGRFLLLNATSFVLFALGAVLGPLLFGLDGAGVGAALFGISLFALFAWHVFMLEANAS
jgi:O-antigen/teichoic acid export membrane protein